METQRITIAKVGGVAADVILQRLRHWSAADFKSYHWLDILQAALNDPGVKRTAKAKAITLLFADHDGPITVVTRN